LNLIVLAYSGGVHSTAAIPWLTEHYAADIVTLTVDVDRRRGLEAVRDRALAAGAIRAHVVDVSDEFAHEFIAPALSAGALATRADLTHASLMQAMIAKQLAHLALLEGARVVAHGAERAQASVFEHLMQDLDPALAVLAPVADWAFSSAELAEYARRHRLPPASVEAPGRAAGSPPDSPAHVDVAFDQGVPIALNGVPLPFVDLLASLDTLAGAQRVEADSVGLLLQAHRALQSKTVDPHVDRSLGKRSVDYAELVIGGRWFAAARKEADAFVLSLQRDVTGTARLRLSNGRSVVVECRSGSVPSDLPMVTEVVAARS
jgi:argininosuccinate synthase